MENERAQVLEELVAAAQKIEDAGLADDPRVLAAMEGVMGTDSREAVEARNVIRDALYVAGWSGPTGEFRTNFADRFLVALRADPAAARAVRDAIDPDGLREAVAGYLIWLGLWVQEHPEHALGWLAASQLRALIEGTPDAD